MENILRLQDGDVDEEESNRCQKNAGPKSETEDLIVAAQDQALKTNYMLAKIIKNSTDPSFRICGRFQETLDHITSGCPKLGKTEYIHRHKTVAAYVHSNI